MTNDRGWTRGDWLAQMRRLGPVIENWRDVAERERHLPRALFEALREAGVFALSTPRTLGGAEVDESTAVEVIEELSRQDGSVGWNAMVASNTAMITSYLAAPALETVYRGGPSTVVAGALLPKGMAVPVANGYRLSGRWTLASGCHQADWLVACSTIIVDGAPRMRPDGRPDVRTLHLPMADCIIHDTWHTALARYSAVVALNRAMAIAESEGPERGLEAVTAIAGVERLAGYPFYPAAVAELTLRLGRPLVAKPYFALAKALARNEGERRFLERRLDECTRLATS